ncbi:hypothetical protein [Streptomyces sp. OE57]|uniref:hypothetical protein n=1 Tax=Streptomyces lacaronensis TaxID=3379885 RepID=UPI0039B75C54
MPPTILSGVHMAGTIALISGFGNLGGFLGPYPMGVAEAATGPGRHGPLRHRRRRGGRCVHGHHPPLGRNTDHTVR